MLADASQIWLAVTQTRIEILEPLLAYLSETRSLKSDYLGYLWLDRLGLRLLENSLYPLLPFYEHFKPILPELVQRLPIPPSVN